MKINILKCGLISVAAIAGLTAIFTGCGDKSSDPYEIISSSSITSSAPVYSAPFEETLISPIRVSQFGVTWNGDKTKCLFQGSALLDGWDSLANVGTLNEPFFTNVILDLARIQDDGTPVVTPLSALLTYTPPQLPSSVINFTQMEVGFEDLNKIECGNYRLIAYFVATNDTIGSPNYKEDKFISVDTLNFSREESYCVVAPIESSSSEAAVVSTVELVKGEGSASTNPSKSFDFITGQEMMRSEGGQIGFSLNEEEEINLLGLNGYQVVDYNNDADVTNFNDDWSSVLLPPEPAHLNDFRFNKNSLSTEYEGFENARFYIVVGPNYNAETGDDFFALTLKEKQNKDVNGIMRFSIIYYKKK